MTKIAIAKGDGIDPEMMDAVLRIFDSATIPLEYELVDMESGFLTKALTMA